MGPRAPRRRARAWRPGASRSAACAGHPATSTTRSSSSAARRRPRTAGEAYGFSLVYSGNFLAEAEVDAAVDDPGPARDRPGGVRLAPRAGRGVRAARGRPGLLRRTGLGGPERRLSRPVPRAAGPRYLARPAATGAHQQLGGHVLRLRRAEAARDGRRRRATSGSSCSSSTTAGSERATTTRPRSATGSSTGASCPTGSTGSPARSRRSGCGSGCGSSPRWSARRSRLFAEHPDWAIGVPGRPRTESRQQLVLDMSRPEVVDHLFGVLSDVLGSAPVSYVKWDMNRNITEPYSLGPAAPTARASSSIATSSASTTSTGD